MYVILLICVISSHQYVQLSNVVDKWLVGSFWAGIYDEAMAQVVARLGKEQSDKLVHKSKQNTEKH